MKLFNLLALLSLASLATLNGASAKKIRGSNPHPKNIPDEAAASQDENDHQKERNLKSNSRNNGYTYGGTTTGHVQGYGHYGQYGYGNTGTYNNNRNSRSGSNSRQTGGTYNTGHVQGYGHYGQYGYGNTGTGYNNRNSRSGSRSGSNRFNTGYGGTGGNVWLDGTTHNSQASVGQVTVTSNSGSVNTNPSTSGGGTVTYSGTTSTQSSSGAGSGGTYIDRLPPPQQQQQAGPPQYRNVAVVVNYPSNPEQVSWTLFDGNNFPLMQSNFNSVLVPEMSVDIELLRTGPYKLVMNNYLGNGISGGAGWVKVLDVSGLSELDRMNVDAVIHESTPVVFQQGGNFGPMLQAQFWLY